MATKVSRVSKDIIHIIKINNEYLVLEISAISLHTFDVLYKQGKNCNN